MRTTKNSIIVITFTASSIISNHCLAGAWTLPEGNLYDKMSLNHYASGPNFTDTNLGNYFEYGLTDSLSIINSVYYKRITNRYDSIASGTTTTTTTTGISDIEIGLKHKLEEGPSGIFSQEIIVKIPGAYDKNSTLPLGNGQIDVEYRILYGLSLWRWFPGYGNFEAGYRYRAEAPSGEFRYLAEVGTNITERLYARIKLDGILSMKNAGNTTNINGNPTTASQFDLQKLDSALGYKLTDTWGLELGYTPTLNAKNTAEGTSYSVGITYMLK
jgi:hypothetical protein